MSIERKKELLLPPLRKLKRALDGYLQDKKGIQPDLFTLEMMVPVSQFAPDCKKSDRLWIAWKIKLAVIEVQMAYTQWQLEMDKLSREDKKERLRLKLAGEGIGLPHEGRRPWCDLCRLSRQLEKATPLEIYSTAVLFRKWVSEQIKDPRDFYDPSEHYHLIEERWGGTLKE